MSANQVVPIPLPASNQDQDWGEGGTTTVYFPGFADLSTPTGSYVQSPRFCCLGQEWHVRLYPHGWCADNVEHASVSLSTTVVPNNYTIKVVFQLSVKDRVIFQTQEFNSYNGECGTGKFLKRDKVLAYLDDGVLAIEVKMKLFNNPPPYIPVNPSACKTIQDLFMDEEYADVVLEVGGEECVSTGRNKREKVTFYAHRNILQKAAPLLAELIISDESQARVDIPQTSPDTFRALLLYIYGCEIPELGEDLAHTKDIIQIADKYGVTNLKLEAEARYVKSVKFNLENIADCLLFAESKNCALLKEAVMNFIVNNAAEINEGNALTDVHGDFLNDVVAILAINKRKCQADVECSEKLSVLSINALRHEAHESGLDVDGTREMLISLLKNACSLDEDWEDDSAEADDDGLEDVDDESE